MQDFHYNFYTWFKLTRKITDYKLTWKGVQKNQNRKWGLRNHVFALFI